MAIIKRKDLAQIIRGDRSLISAENDITALFNSIASSLEVGDTVSIAGFGKFEPKLQKGKSGTVPGTTKTYVTQDKMVPKFSAAKAFKDAIAGL